MNKKTDKQKEIELKNKEVKTYVQAAEIMRKYLNSTTERKESWLVTTLRDICAKDEPELDMHAFCFENTKDAAKWNEKIMRSYDNNFATAINNHKNTTLQPGSEFRPLDKLEKIWKHRTNWKFIEETLREGAVYPLKQPRDEETRIADLKGMIERGNHKSCERPDLNKALKKNITKELKRGWQIPLPIPYLLELKGAGIIPMGVQDQHSINEKGERIPKPRVTHDASFPNPSGYSKIY